MSLETPTVLLGFDYLGGGVSLHGCSSKLQLPHLTLDEGYLLTAAPPDLERGVAPLDSSARYLIDRVPDELWTEVHDIVQETGIKTIPMEKKCKKAKCLSEEALQIAVKRREAKSKGEKERYKHLNAEFQRIARRDKKAFLSDQCKEIEENN